MTGTRSPVIVREGGRSSIPPALQSNGQATAYWIPRRLSSGRAFARPLAGYEVKEAYPPRSTVIVREGERSSIPGDPMGARSFYVYILASRIGGTLYIGVTMTSFAEWLSIA